MSTGNRLNVKYAFGLNPNIKNTLSLVEDHHLVYACGHQAVVVNIETKEQNFIPGSVHPHVSQGVSAIACNTPKKIIAIAEVADPVGAVALYDSQSLRRRKILQYPELGSREIVCVAFSNDGRLCVTQGAGPEWNLVLWNIERAVKVIGSVKISLSDDTPVNQVSFCPWDSNVIVVIGKGYVRLFRVTEGQLRPISVNVRRDSHTNFLSHAWMWEEKLLLGTEGGEILLLENLEFRTVIYPPSGEVVEPAPILSLYPVAKGFIAGTVFGDMWIFEISEDVKEQYQREEPITVPGAKGGVVSIVGSVDDSLVCATDTQQLYAFNMSSLGAAKEGGSSGIDHLLTAFHGPSDLGDPTIVGIDTALWRPVIATCGKDYSVRIWNTQDRKIEIMKTFQEEPFSLALHPSGLYVAVGFTDKIKLMSVLLDDMSTTREFHIRSCSCMRFSAGGHLLACANGANVQIFSTYTGIMLTSLRHTAKVRAVTWMTLDSKILTVSQEGSVFIWSVDKDKNHNASDSYAGVLPITSGISFQDGSKAFTVAADMIVKEIQLRKTVDQTTGSENAIRPPRDVTIDRHVSCVTLHEAKKILFLGTSETEKPGAILSMIASPHLATQYETTVLHAANITAMALSPDGDTLYSADANGCLLISDVEGGGSGRAQQLAKARAAAGAPGDVIGAAPGAGSSSGVAADFIEDVLIHKADLDAKRQKVNDLMAKVEELTLNNEHLLRVKEIEHKDTVADIRNKFNAQLNSERFTYENVRAEKRTVEDDNATEIDHLQIQQENELSAVEDKYKAKLNAEAVRHRQLAAETEEVHKRWNEENRDLVDAHQSHLQSLTAEYELKLSVEQNAQKALRNEKEVIQHEHEISQDHVERDIDIEVTEMKAKYEARIKFEEEASVALTHEHTVMKRNLQMLNKDTEQQMEEIKRLKDKEDRLVETIHSLEKDIQSHKKEIREREETITDKEKRIFDLKKKNQELEKFRFVLDYKIKELKLQIAPREAEITTMRKQIEEMDLELEQYHKSNAALLLMISELKLKIEGLRRELVTQDDRIVVNSGLIDRFMKDLKEAHAVRNDHPILKSKVVNLFRMYVQEDSGGKGDGGGAAGPEDPQLQYNRDREQMERSMDALRRSLHTDAALQKRDMSKMNRESVVLTRELNELRKDEQTLQMKYEAVDRVQRSANKSNILQLMTQYGLNNGKEATVSKQNIPPVPPSQGRSSSIKRSTALRSASAGGDSGLGTAGKSRSDLREAWRELEMQTSQISNLEEQLRSLCLSLNVDYLNELAVVDDLTCGSNNPAT